MFKTYKYRLYPNKKQTEQIQKTFGCCRFVYNQVLNYRINLYENEKKSINKFDCNNYKNKVLKEKYPWLKEVDKFALENAIFNMDSAFQKFFKEHSGFPKFKSKHNHKKSYKTNFSNNIRISFENNKIKLPKLNWVKVKFHRTFSGKIKSAVISQNSSGKYYVSILIETENESTFLPSTNSSIGIDLGIKNLIITSNGDKFDNIYIIKKYEKKLAKEQRKLSKKVKDSKNYEKQRKKVAVIYEKIHNSRIDYLHKISHKLIIENQVIVSENLSVTNMTKNHNLSKSILDCSWYELTRQLQYKTEWYNKSYIKVDRFFPSSQTCHVCGYINKDVKNLAVRNWKCPQCNTIHDRDINAAINILNEGLKLL